MQNYALWRFTKPWFRSQISNIYPKQNDKQINTGPCYACNGPHLVKDCNESICSRCKPNLDDHTPSKCPRRCFFNRQHGSNPFHNTDNSNRNKINSHIKPNLQLTISTSKLDYMAELLEATRKMTKYFKKSYKHSKSHPSDNDIHCLSTNNYSSPHSDKHKCKSHNNNDEVNEVINQTCTSNSLISEPKDSKEHHKSDSSDSILDSSLDSEWLSWTDEIIEVKLSNIKYATNFPVTINKNEIISLFDTGDIISCISKECFDKLDPKPASIQTHTYTVYGTNDNSLGPPWTTTCTLEFLKKFQQQFIVCKHLLRPIIFELHFSP